MRRPRVAGHRHRPTDRPPTPPPDSASPTVPPREPDAPDPRAGHEEEAEQAAATVSLPKIDLGTDEPLEPAAPEPAAEKPAEPAEAEGEGEDVERPRRPRVQRPAGKRRATGITRPADLTAAEAETKAPVTHRLAPGPRRVTNPYSVAVILAVMAAILAGLAFWFRGEASALESRDPNTALTDAATTSEVLGQLTTAIETTLSYNYTDLESTKKAVEDSLADTARCEYDQLFAQLKKLAPEQKIILATTVRDIGLVRLDGDRAEALVFIDLVSTRVDTNKSVPGDAVFGVHARREDDTWKITEFDMFDQQLPTGEQVPQC